MSPPSWSACCRSRGEDAITIDRKYRDPWTGRLGVRFLLLTNELPRFSDASTALAKRFVVLVLTRSFYGDEDPAFLTKILPELPGILNWALDGLDRLRAQGQFTEPVSSREAIRELEDLASPVAAFLRDRCFVGRDQHVAVTRCGRPGRTGARTSRVPRHQGDVRTGPARRGPGPAMSRPRVMATVIVSMSASGCAPNNDHRTA